MRRPIYVALLLSLSLLASFSAGKEKHAPLPQEVLTAKTLYLDNRSGFANLGDRAYDELNKWGRFQIVDSADKADLVLLLSTSAYVGGYVTRTSHSTHGTVDDSGDVNLEGKSSSRTRPVTVNLSHITLINPKNGANLWSDQKPWGWKSATRGLVKELRDRIAEQEKAAKQ